MPCWPRRTSTGPKSIRRFLARCSSAVSIRGKRAQFGAHYTDRDKTMLIVEPVIVGRWLAK